MPASFVDCRGCSADTGHPSFDAVLQTEDPKSLWVLAADGGRGMTAEVPFHSAVPAAALAMAGVGEDPGAAAYSTEQKRKFIERNRS